jgi:hypothetical protein
LNRTTEGIYKQITNGVSKDESAMKEMKIIQLKTKNESDSKLQNKRAHHPTIHHGGE